MTNKNHIRRIQRYHTDPNKGYAPQFGEITYIYAVNWAIKVKSDAQVATNKNSNPVQKLSL